MEPIRIGFIGSRDLTQFTATEIAIFRQAAAVTARAGHTLVTGFADGADDLAMMTALEAGGTVELKLPWRSFRKERLHPLLAGEHHPRIQIEVFDADLHGEWIQSVYAYHPAARILKDSEFRLHARNYGIVRPTQLVVALPSRNRNGGGTAQGLRVARALGVPILDLTRPDDLGRVLDHPLLKAA